MRKVLNLHLEEEIVLELNIDDRVAGLVRELEALIAEKVQAAESGTIADSHRKTWNVKGVEKEIMIEPLGALEQSD